MDVDLQRWIRVRFLLQTSNRQKPNREKVLAGGRAVQGERFFDENDEIPPSQEGQLDLKQASP